MSPWVHHPGRSVRANPTVSPYIPSHSVFTHSSPSAFAPPQFGSLSIFGGYYDDSSSGESSTSNSSLDESDHTENRRDDRHIFDSQSDLNSSSNGGSATTLSEFEMSSMYQSSNTEDQVEEPDRESRVQPVPVAPRRVFTSLPTRFVYTAGPGLPANQQEQQQRVQQQQQQQRFYVPPESDPNYHASRRVMASAASALPAPIGTRRSAAPVETQPPPHQQQQNSRQSYASVATASTGTTTDVVQPTSYFDPLSRPFSSATRLGPAFGFGSSTALGTGSDGRGTRSGRGLGPPRRERERETHRSNEGRESERDRAIPPQFRAKTVCKLDCRGCGSVVCMRGMKAMLLADTRVELFSTDCPPVSVQLVGEDYMTRNCRCKIRDVACIGCGGVCGYHITAPCGRCMEACNNGHFWMFHTEGVKSIDRLDGSGSKTLLWASLPVVENDIDPSDVYDRMCR